MRQEDIKIVNGGVTVICSLEAKGNQTAHEVHAFADENPPLGYILLSCSIARRRNGGQLRFIRLKYQHTGNDEHPPMDDWEQWTETLAAEQKISRGGWS